MELPTPEHKDKISIQIFEDILQHRYLEYTNNNFAIVQRCSAKKGEPDSGKTLAVVFCCSMT